MVDKLGAHFARTPGDLHDCIKAAGEVVVNVTGSGDLDVAKLIADKLQIGLFGNGSIESHVSDTPMYTTWVRDTSLFADNPPVCKLEKYGSGAILFK